MVLVTKASVLLMKRESQMSMVMPMSWYLCKQAHQQLTKLESQTSTVTIMSCDLLTTVRTEFSELKSTLRSHKTALNMLVGGHSLLLYALKRVKQPGKQARKQ